MKFLVDTCVWSEVLRKKGATQKVYDSFVQSVIQSHVTMIGPIRQEILSGIKSASQFQHLKHLLDAFPDEPLMSEDFVRAAHYFNTCRAKGIQGSNTDFLICSVAQRLSLLILTTDKDFDQFAKHLPIRVSRI